MNHKTVQVKRPGGLIVDIDEGIVDLIQMIWRCGFSTFNSCEDNNGNIWVEFASMDEFTRLCQTAHTFNLEHGVKYEYETLSNFLISDCICTVNILDDGYVTKNNVEYISGKNVFLSVSVRFGKIDKNQFIRLWKETYHSRNW